MLPCTQEKTDREQATLFFATITAGTVLASKGDIDDSESGGEPVWFSIAKDKLQINDDEKFSAGGGAGPSGVRTIAKGWSYFDVAWLNKVKTDSEGNVHFEKWIQSHGERTVLTRTKILCVPIMWLREDSRRNAPTRYVLSAAAYQRLIDAV